MVVGQVAEATRGAPIADIRDGKWITKNSGSSDPIWLTQRLQHYPLTLNQ